MSKIRWEQKADGWWLMAGKRVVATVYKNGVWHTWDRQGTGGENSQEDTVARAKIEAAASVIEQGFL